jgi:hypothetical protein
MNHPSALQTRSGSQGSITEELIAAAIAGLINSAHSTGQSLEELTSLVLAEDPELDQMTRKWLSDIVTEAWQDFALEEPATEAELEPELEWLLAA